MAFIAFARSMIEDAFGGFDPRTAQRNMAVERYPELLGKLKPAFIHHDDDRDVPILQTRATYYECHEVSV